MSRAGPTCSTIDVGNRSTQLANAAFIVRAVNSHDALVEAAKNLIDEISTRGTHERWKRLANLIHDLVSSPSGSGK
jgi:hypothetical protein